MATTNEKLVTLPVLTYYDTKNKQWVTEQLSKAVADLGNIFTIKGTVATVDDLPIENNAKGDVYLVGAEGSDTYEEYYWEGTRWEYMGTSGIDEGEVITKTDLYEGEDGTGTVADPAEGTIVYNIYNKMKDLEARVKTNEDNIAALSEQINNVVTDSDIDDMFA